MQTVNISFAITGIPRCAWTCVLAGCFALVWSLLFLQALQLSEGGTLFNFYNGPASLKYILLMQESRSGFFQSFIFLLLFSLGRALDSQNQGKKSLFHRNGQRSILQDHLLLREGTWFSSALCSRRNAKGWWNKDITSLCINCVKYVIYMQDWGELGQSYFFIRFLKLDLSLPINTVRLSWFVSRHWQKEAIRSVLILWCLAAK